MSRKIIDIDKLPSDTQSDIIDTLIDIVPELSGMSYEEVRQNLIGLAESPPTILTTVNPAKMKAQFGSNRATSKTAIEKLKNLLLRGVTLDPILISHGKFLDGGHRVMAYFEAGFDTMPAVDIGHLIKMDWEKWLAGDKVAFKLN